MKNLHKEWRPFIWQGQKDSPFLRKSEAGSDSTLCCLHSRPVRILYSVPNEKPPQRVEAFHLAGAEGFEPSTKVLETHVLPLHHAPNRNGEIIRKQ